MFRANLVIAVLVLLARAMVGQEPGQQDQEPAVLTPTLVKGKNGEIVYGLQAKDFIIEDDGVEQPAHLDDAPEAVEVSLVVAIQLRRTAAAELPRIRTLAAMLDPILAEGATALRSYVRQRSGLSPRLYQQWRSHRSGSGETAARRSKGRYP